MTDLEHAALARFIRLRHESRRCLCVSQRVEVTPTGVWVKCSGARNCDYAVWFANYDLTERSAVTA